MVQVELEALKQRQYLAVMSVCTDDPGRPLPRSCFYSSTLHGVPINKKKNLNQSMFAVHVSCWVICDSSSLRDSAPAFAPNSPGRCVKKKRKKAEAEARRGGGAGAASCKVRADEGVGVQGCCVVALCEPGFVSLCVFIAGEELFQSFCQPAAKLHFLPRPCSCCEASQPNGGRARQAACTPA